MSSLFINSYSNEILKCVLKANELNLAVSFTPHLDDYDEKLWRDYFDFDPLEKYQEFSYDEITLSSLFKEINESNLKVDFFVSCEMGKSYYLYPNSYKTIAKKLKQLTSANIGISFNYNNMLGLYYKVESINWDMIGFSNYLPVRVNCDASDFQEHLIIVKNQLSFLGLDHLSLHFNEVGIGGISAQADVYEIVKHPHRGVGGRVFTIKGSMAERRFKKYERQISSMPFKFFEVYYSNRICFFMEFRFLGSTRIISIYS